MFFKINKSNVTYARKGENFLGMKEKYIPEVVHWSNDYLENESGILNLGVAEKNEIVKVDLNKTPHILIAGNGGVGKTVAWECMIWQLKNQGADINIIELRDHSISEFNSFEKIGNVLRDIDSVDKLLQELVAEHTRRINILKGEGFENINDYNYKRCESKQLSRIVVVIDELNALLYRDDPSINDIEKIFGVDWINKSLYRDELKDKLNRIEDNLNILARLARPTGINLLIATARPEFGLLNNQLRNNIPVKICGSYIESNVSELVLGNEMARKIVRIQGRFVVKIGGEFKETQLYYFDEEKDLKFLD